MTPLFDSQGYYKKMLELQEKLRKSEEDRIRLEERFNLLEQESRIRHEACINKLRMRYIEFLEEQRIRDERNRKLLGALDKVDSSLAVMTAKTDRLYSLRKEYEASILRAHTSRRPTPSVAGDSGILSQLDDRRLHKYPSPGFPSASASLSTLLHPRRVCSPPAPSPPLPRPLSYPPRPILNFHDRPTWALPSLSLPHQDLDSLRTPRYPKESPFFYPESINPLKPSRLISTPLLSTPDYEEEKTGNAVENELERYISKIKSLHGDVEHSQEDHEQNTSGDLLNVTLSDDGFDHLPPEGKTKGLPNEVEKVLALADDLAARTVEPPEEPGMDPPGDDVNSSEGSQLQHPDGAKSVANDSAIKVSQSVDLPEQRGDSPMTVGPPEASAQNIAEEVVNNDGDVEEVEPWSPETVQAQVEAVLINQEGLENEEAKSASDSGDKNKPDDFGNQDDSLMRAGGDDVKGDVNLTSDGEGDAVVEADGGQGVEGYKEGSYGDSAGYDYGNQGEGYQYPEGYQYNYGEGGEVIDGGYPGAGEQYQGENYGTNGEYQQENYQEGSNVEYPEGNYGDGGGGQYQEGSYPAGEGNEQYQDGNYPQEGSYPQYEESSQQYQGEYPAEGNQVYDASNYGYSYGQEGYQEYQEAPGHNGESAEPVQQVEGSSAKEQGVEEESKTKKDVIKSILESETESSIEKNTENTESDFDFN
ncbi:uncharacterized protein LOC135170062 [Diachasmimorpha longicaudata]|uniref:uncharacterized protein LOC135170062 n=1 Tax=Diachasmimorpha longicaudata TaxID=58733 RepID=UPI0030B8B992